MKNQILKIGIISREDYKKRTIAIASGKYKPKSNEPIIWFESLQSMAQVLNNNNQKLLKVILEHKPKSIKELESFTGRKSSNLSRTLKMLSRYGIVHLEKISRNIKPTVKATSFQVEFCINGVLSEKTHLRVKKNFN